MGFADAALIVCFSSVSHAASLAGLLYVWHVEEYRQGVITLGRLAMESASLEWDRFVVAALVSALMLWWLPFYFSTITLAGSRTQGYDNSHPRALRSELSQKGGSLAVRLYSAHENSFEQSVLFAMPLLCTLVIRDEHPIPDDVAFLAVCWLIARVVYVLCYALGLSTLRSVVFNIGQSTTLILFIGALFGTSQLRTILKSNADNFFEE